jgi:hypothetical protein
MGRHVEEEAEWDNEGWEADENDRDGDAEDEPTIPCPYCRRAIYEDSPQCPYCRRYILDEDASPSRKPWWVILGVLLCLAAIWVWIASR